MSVALSDERMDKFIEPILVLEMRRFRRRGFRLVAVFALLIAMLPVAVLLWRPDANSARFALEAVAGIYLFLAIVMIPAYGARSISHERETGAWDMLAMTLMRSSQIADQRIAAAALPMFVLLVAGVPVALTLTFFGGATPLELVSLGAILVLTALTASAWSVEASSDCGRSATAVAYLPALVHLCGGIAVALCVVGVVVLLITPTQRGQAGRLLLGGLCVLVGTGLSQYLVAIMFFQSLTALVPGLSGSWFDGLPPYVPAIVTLGVGVLTLMGIRCVLVRSIERQRRGL